MFNNSVLLDQDSIVLIKLTRSRKVTTLYQKLPSYLFSCNAKYVVEDFRIRDVHDPILTKDSGPTYTIGTEIVM